MKISVHFQSSGAIGRPAKFLARGGAWRTGGGAKPAARARAGLTLVEMLVAAGAGTLVLASLMATTIFVARSMVAIGNYDDLNAMSRNALDRLSRDVRNTSTLTSYATNQLAFYNNLTGDRFSYFWDGSTLTRVYQYSNGTVTSDVLLTNCDTLAFHIYSRVPSNNFAFYPTSTITNAKLIDVTWRCSRQIYGKKINTESVQTARIVIRN